MKFLYFLRHGKAEAPQFDQEDRDRRLTSSGQRSATAMGNHARERGFRIDVVLTSTARRTAETTELFLAAFGQSVPVRQLTGLYLASPEEILAHVAELDDATDSVVIIGHNPGLSELAIMLVASGPAPARSLLARGFPTAALAEIAVDAASWRQVAPGRGRLVRFTRPGDLPADTAGDQEPGAA